MHRSKDKPICLVIAKGRRLFQFVSIPCDLPLGCRRFRYVQVEGLAPGFTPTNDTLTALFVHSAVKPSGKVAFNSSFDILNKIQTAIVYTELSNLHRCAVVSVSLKNHIFSAMLFYHCRHHKHSLASTSPAPAPL